MTMTDEEFRDLYDELFGFGYGTGDLHTLPLLTVFIQELPVAGTYAYDYRRLEGKFKSDTAWLMINILCKADLIEYGSSPRFGWLTAKGASLKQYLADKRIDELYELVLL